MFSPLLFLERPIVTAWWAMCPADLRSPEAAAAAVDRDAANVVGGEAETVL